MSEPTCLLSTKDLTILEVMLDHHGDSDPIARLIGQKISSAVVMFRNDIPENVATLSSRVQFSIDGQDALTRVIVHDPALLPVGLALPISSPRGLALLGLVQGQEYVLENDTGPERLVLERVLYQPEAARRARQAMDNQDPAPPRPIGWMMPGAAYTPASRPRQPDPIGLGRATEVFDSHDLSLAGSSTDHEEEVARTLASVAAAARATGKNVVRHEPARTRRTSPEEA